MTLIAIDIQKSLMLPAEWQSWKTEPVGHFIRPKSANNHQSAISKVERWLQALVPP